VGFITRLSELANVGGRSMSAPWRRVRSSDTRRVHGTCRAIAARLVVGEQTLEIVVGEHAKIAFLCSGLQRKGLTIVTAASGSLEQRLQLVHLLEELVDEEPFVHDVDEPAFVAQRSALEGESRGSQHEAGWPFSAKKSRKRRCSARVGTSS